MNRAFIYATTAGMLTVLVFSAGCCISADNLFKATHQKTESVHLPVAGVNTVDIETDVGSITINGADVDECHVNAEVTVRAYSKEKAKELAESVKIEIEPEDDTIRIRASRPEDLKEQSLTVEFEITVPTAFLIRAKSKVGSVTVTGIDGTIDARTDVGSLTCKDVAGDLELHTNVGSVTVACRPDAPEAFNAEMRTNVGSITFGAPDQLSAEVSASTNIGSVSTNRPITVVGKLGKSMNGTIGEGEGRITLSTNVGSIEIK